MLAPWFKDAYPQKIESEMMNHFQSIATQIFHVKSKNAEHIIYPTSMVF